MEEKDQYAMIRKAVYNQRFLTWMEHKFLDIDSETIENETTDLYNGLQKMLEGKPLVPAIVALCEVTCKTYEGIIDNKVKR